MKMLKMLALALSLCAMSTNNVSAKHPSNIDEIESDDSNFIDAPQGNPSTFTRYDVITEVTQRFYKYQNAESHAKRVGRDTAHPDRLIKALNKLGTFLVPDFQLFEFITVGLVIPVTSVTELQEFFFEFATEDFNAWSQHFATNVVVIPSKDFTSAKMTAGGGEYASLNPSAPYEQTTISNWHVTWVWLEDGPSGPNYYINSYREYGDRLFRFCPPCGPYTLFFERLWPGATPEGTADSCTDCP